MLKVKVEHNIGDICEHSINETKFRVIGYNYISGESVRYICVCSDTTEIKYMTGAELKPHKERTIGFTIK